MPGTGARPRSELGRLAEFVHDRVADGADTAEEIHRKVVALPLEVLDRNGILRDEVRRWQRFQGRAIGAVYDFVRGVNDDLTRLAKEVVEPPPTRRPRARRKPPAQRPASQAA